MQSRSNRRRKHKDGIEKQSHQAASCVGGRLCLLLRSACRCQQRHKDKIAAAEAASIQESLQQLPNAGNFTEVSDFQPANNEKATATAVYVDENQQTAVLVTANGYNKGGLQVVIGLDAEGTVTGITFVSVTETPGLGTKVQSNPELLTDHLVGLSDAAAVEQVDGITGATYSSNGMKAAVTCAMDTFAQSKEAILS